MPGRGARQAAHQQADGDGADGVEQRVHRGHHPAQRQRPLQRLDDGTGRERDERRRSSGRRRTATADGASSSRLPSSCSTVAPESSPRIYQHTSGSPRLPTVTDPPGRRLDAPGVT